MSIWTLDDPAITLDDAGYTLDGAYDPGEPAPPQVLEFDAPVSVRVYAGAVGIPIRLTFTQGDEVLDLEAATTREITIQHPNNTLQVEAAAVATDSKGRACLEYVTQAGDLDIAGRYYVQGRIENAAGLWFAKTGKFLAWRPLRFD